MKTLFIGNSYTYGNDLPGVLQHLASAAGMDLEAVSVTKGGVSLGWHCYNPASTEAVAAKDLDFVFLQEQSLLPIEDPGKFQRAVVKWNDRIRAAEAVPVLYITWAREHLPEMQTELTQSYMQIGRRIGARMAPVGPAWAKARAAAPDLSLHTPDRSHANLLGTYLTACVLYATLFKTTPVGLNHSFPLCSKVSAEVAPETAALLQKTAWESLRELD